MNEQQTTENEPKPWDRQQGEKIKSFEFFKLYLELGRIRSLKKVSEITGYSLRSIAGYSTRNDWAERAEKFDLREFEEENEKLMITLESNAMCQFEQKLNLAELVQDLLTCIMPHLKNFGQEFNNQEVAKKISHLNSLINTVIGLYKISHYSLNSKPINEIMDKDLRNNRYIRRRRLKNINDSSPAMNFDSFMDDIKNITKLLK
jgi:hypothetical protein